MGLTQVAPGHTTAGHPATPPGVWRVSDGTRTAYAAAGAANPPELADLRATGTLLGKLARASGGGIHWLDTGAEHASVPSLRRTEPDREASGSGWIGLQRRHDHIVTGVATSRIVAALAGTAADFGACARRVAARRGMT